jgi:succinoglycan biosynthesis transport protein ExoP
MEQIQHYGRVVLKWKWTSLFFFFSVVIGVALFSFLSTPIFTASGDLWIEDEPNILSFEGTQAIGNDTNVQSHVYLLQSRTLAIDTIEKLKLFDNPEFIGKSAQGKGPVDSSNPIFRERVIRNFLKAIVVTPVQGTKLVNVNFSHSNPKLASDTLNALFDGYVAILIKKRYLDSEQVKENLKIPIAALRAEIDEREKKLDAYGLKKDILPLTAKETPTITRLAEYNKALTDATIARTNKLNYYNQVKSATLGEITDTPAGSPIQNLRAQYSTLSREYSKKLLTLRPEYPEMQRLKSELDSASGALQNETLNLVRAAYADYQAALTKEQSLQKMLEDLKGEAFKMNSDSVTYNNLRIELDNKKTLLENLTKKQNESDVSSRLKGLDAINVWVVNKADIPMRPTYPNKRKNVLIALLIGFIGGVGLALGLEYSTQTINTTKDITMYTGLSTLGVVPSFGAEPKTKGPRSEFKRIVQIITGGGGTKERKNQPPLKGGSLSFSKADTPGSVIADEERQKKMIELVAWYRPQSIQSESYRSIRTALLVSSYPGKVKSILFTSPLPGDGKSSTISNLAITLAAAKMRVVVVDSDLRKPKQHRIFSEANGPGLTRFLTSQIDPTDLVMTTRFPNLSLIICGPISANPIELLASEKMNNLSAYLKKNFDYILFDTPPILAVSDALCMAPMVDGIILIARGGRTPRQAMKQTEQKLRAHNLKCLGVILNDVDLIEQDGHYARQYYHYYTKSE